MSLRFPYSSATDGIDHINIYSKGKTELGRLLSNFAHTPFDCEDGHFESELPLAHYYEYPNKVIPLPQYDWMIEHMEAIRKDLKGY